MTEQSLITTIDKRGVARLTLNRPDVRNAFDECLINQICDTMGRLSADENVRIVVLTGIGNVFCAGADLNMMRRVAEYTQTENTDDARRLAHMLRSIYHSPKPTIARVNGPAIGGGLGLIAACDISIGVNDAFFALSEVRVGLIPAVISPFVIEAMGPQQARRYFLSGEKFDAERARELGLLHELAPASELDDQLEKIIAKILVGSPNAHKEVKLLISAVTGREIDNRVFNDTAKRIAKIRASKEGKEGVTAFLEKRKPNWIAEEE